MKKKNFDKYHYHEVTDRAELFLSVWSTQVAELFLLRKILN